MKSPRQAFYRAQFTRVRAVPLALLALGGGAPAGCVQDTQEVPVPALDRSGDLSFVCLAAPGSKPLGRPVRECTSGANDLGDFGGGLVPHLYALVTQTTRGEVALIDLSVPSDLGVIDQNPVVPGASFLPVGAQPTSIQSSPGGTATFVGVGEPGRSGIFVLPSASIRPCEACAPKTMTSWPACSLPSAPGSMVFVSDPAAGGLERQRCDGKYEAPETGGAFGSLSDEGFGRQKLVVSMPEEGGFVIIDAQELLNRAPGSFDPCPVERNEIVKLRVDLPPNSPATDSPVATDACVDSSVPPPIITSVPTPRPSWMAGIAPSAGLSDARHKLYIADLNAPLIHVVDFNGACEPREISPLALSSLSDPARVVTAGKLATSINAGPEFKSFLYAIDSYDGSLMAFDVTDGAARTPIQRAHPEWNPFQPTDRVRFGSPVVDLSMVNIDLPAERPATGAAPAGVRCDPDPDLKVCCDPNLSTCKVDPATCDLSASYRTSSDFTEGARPLNLRGTFVFAFLSTGQAAVVDVDDLDAQCRVPQEFSPIYGCPPAEAADPNPDKPLKTVGELSCNVVTPHAIRSAAFALSADGVGRNQPGLVSYPLLYDKSGNIIELDTKANPILRATLPASDAKVALKLAVGGNVETIERKTGMILKDETPQHTLRMNLEDPRAQVADDVWTVTYEAALPGFDGKVGELRLTGAEDDGLYDANSQFCNAGVRSQASVSDELQAQGLGVTEREKLSVALADYLQITTEILPQDNAHWANAAECSYQQCRATFGDTTLPRPERELLIREAYQDHLETAEGLAPASLIQCCFPTLVAFTVRPHGQWVALGQNAGFLHHVTTDPASGVCRNSCEARKARLNARIRHAGPGVLSDDDPLAFGNPMFRFSIGGGTAERGMQFRFFTQGAFSPLIINLADSEGQMIQPQSATFVPPTGELAITDGSINGVLLFSTRGLGVTRRYF